MTLMNIVKRARFITVYYPDPEKWNADFKIRKEQ